MFIIGDMTKMYDQQALSWPQMINCWAVERLDALGHGGQLPQPAGNGRTDNGGQPAPGRG